MAIERQAAPGSPRITLGRRGEEAALERYLDLGYRCLARNWRCPLGEIDLVLVKGGLVAFCEVKTRGGDGFGGGYEAVTWRKRAKLRQLGEAFLASRGLVPASVRFDVASVRMRGGVRPDVVVFEDAF
ncbi:MAG TPA: YraN family protein [Actinomycetota bacterium]